MIDRRKFILDSCKACAGMLAIAGTASFISSCSTLDVLKISPVNKVMVVNLKSLKEGVNRYILRNSGLDYDILLVLHQHAKPEALLMKCTHIDNPLVATNSGLACNMHGSRFDFDGKVTNGPAARPLNRFVTEKNENEIKIFLT